MFAIFKHVRSSRRGSVAMMTSIAAIPLLGVAALGSEAGAWYLTRRHAQNAADAAAYAGALALAEDGNWYAAGTAFATSNGFCAGCSAPAGATQTVVLTRGTYAAGTFTANAGGRAVKAVVAQQQPPLLASLFLSGPVNIAASAIAQVQTPSKACVVGLNPDAKKNAGIELGGTTTLNGGGCSLVSDGSVKLDSTVAFAGEGWSLDSMKGCSPAGTCSTESTMVPTNWSSLGASNPFEALDSYNTPGSFGLSSGSAGNYTCNKDPCNALAPTPPGGKPYGKLTLNGGTLTLAPGAYFFNDADIAIKGNLNGTGVNIVLLGNSSLNVSSGAVVDLTANTANANWPMLNGVLIDDQAPAASSNNVTISGSSSSKYGGALYFPYVDVTWGGNSASAMGCTELVGFSVKITATSTFDTSGCPASIVPHTQVVLMVQ